MVDAYANCRNLTAAVCGPNVTNMVRAYANCTNLISGEIGSTVQEFNDVFYGCHNLRQVTIHEGITNINSTAFYYCNNLTEINIPSTVKSLGDNVFKGCYNLKTIRFANKVSLPNISNTSLAGLARGFEICINAGAYGTWDNNSVWEKYKKRIVLDSTEPFIAKDIIEENYLTDLSGIVKVIPTIGIINVEDGADIQVTANISDQSVAKIKNTNVEKLNHIKKVVSVEIEPLKLGTTTITLTVTADSITKTLDAFTVEVIEDVPSSFTVEPIEDVKYTFVLNENGYYESNCQGVNYAYALCKVTINNPKGRNLYLDCINWGQYYWDFGILSNVNCQLTKNNTADSSSSSTVKHSFLNSSTADVQTIDYGQVKEGFIYVKYRKDGSGNHNNDSLQFKVRFEDVN